MSLVEEIACYGRWIVTLNKGVVRKGRQIDQYSGTGTDQKQRTDILLRGICEESVGQRDRLCRWNLDRRGSWPQGMWLVPGLLADAWADMIGMEEFVIKYPRCPERNSDPLGTKVIWGFCIESGTL